MKKIFLSPERLKECQSSFLENGDLKSKKQSGLQPLIKKHFWTNSRPPPFLALGLVFKPPPPPAYQPAGVLVHSFHYQLLPPAYKSTWRCTYYHEKVLLTGVFLSKMNTLVF